VTGTWIVTHSAAPNVGRILPLGFWCFVCSLQQQKLAGIDEPVGFIFNHDNYNFAIYELDQLLQYLYVVYADIFVFG
jgi:hypothetical protein